MTDNADLGRGYPPVVTCARHHQALHVGGTSGHREAGVFELTSPQDLFTADIDEHLAEGISRTTFAPIRVTVPGNVGYTLSGKTSFGRIHSEHEMSVSGEIGTDAITGKIAGGGCESQKPGGATVTPIKAGGH